MPAVNPTIKLPRLPPWLTMERCKGCGALYRDHNSGVDFSDGCQRIRHAAAAEGDESGGFRSTGPVLWAMRVLKAEDWLMSHLWCDPRCQETVKTKETVDAHI